MVLLAAPRVSQLYKSNGVARVILDLLNAQDSVGMSIGEADCVLSGVVAASSTCLHYVAPGISSLKRGP